MFALVAFIASIFIVCLAFANPCDPLFDRDENQLFKADGSPVCESDITTAPYAENCVQVFDDTGEILQEYAQGNPSFHPFKQYYCPNPPETHSTYSGYLQFISDVDKNPLNFPVAGLPFNIPSPGYVVPGGGGCGNGVLDNGEECDFGPPETEGEHAYDMEAGALHQDENGLPIVIVGNDDNIPNWCRSTCTLPVFGDGVIDPSYGEMDDGSGNEMYIGNTQQWIDMAAQFRDDPQAYSEQFIDANEEFVNPGPGGIPDPTPDPGGQATVCDIAKHMCVVLSEATPGSNQVCTKHEECGHFACSFMECKRVAGPGQSKCSEATAKKDCSHLECDGIKCKRVSGKGDDECNVGQPNTCWGKMCSKRASQCVPAPVPKDDSECDYDWNCDPGPDDDNDSSNDGNPGNPGSNTDSGEWWIGVFDLPSGCDPESACEPGKCPNWCEENLNGACTGTIEDWCSAPDNQCNRECVELYVDYQFWATIHTVWYKFNGISTPFAVGEHVGAATNVPSWVAVNRFNKGIVCDSFEVEGGDFEDSILSFYHNHGRTIPIPHSSLTKAKHSWSLEGPTCLEKTPAGAYRVSNWIIEGLDAPKGEFLPACILDNIGNGDCDTDWEDTHLTAVTSRACLEALRKADFFCDAICASDGYVLPYHDMMRELGPNSFKAAVLRVPGVHRSDTYGRKGMHLWNYLARSGYLVNLVGVDLTNPADWPIARARIIKKWEKYHTKEGKFTCKGAYGEAPESHFSVHRKITFGAPGTWVLEALSGIHGHNSNSDAAAQYKLAEHCKSIEEAEVGVDEFTSEYDWRGIHGSRIIKDLCNNHCGGDDARTDAKNIARKDAPFDNGGWTSLYSGASKASKAADHWDLDTALSAFSSVVTGSICASISSNLPFCDAKKHERKDRGQKQVKGM